MLNLPPALAPFTQCAWLTLWSLTSKDTLAANTPAEPTKVAPVKSTVSLAAPLTIPPVSAAVLVIE